MVKKELSLEGPTLKKKKKKFNLFIIQIVCFSDVCEVNRERSRLAAASSVCDSTKHNGLVTVCSIAISSYSVGSNTEHWNSEPIRILNIF